MFEEQNGDFDIALLDIMMPGIDGFTVCKKLREKSATMGIIMLSAKTQEMDKVGRPDDRCGRLCHQAVQPIRAGGAGGRDLSARHDGEQPSKRDLPHKSGPFLLSPKSRTLTKNGILVDLTQVEYQIMDLFLKNKNVALERSRILEEIWGDNYYGDIKIVDVNIRRLRMKIEDEPSNPKYIQTIWGFGYKWQETE